MLNIEKLNEYGANTKEGMERCMNSEDFYFRMITMIPDEANFDRLAEAIANNDLDAAFEAAHGLKGVAGNLSLTPLYDVVAEMTELLRSRTQMDYTDYLDKIAKQREIIKEMIEA